MTSLPTRWTSLALRRTDRPGVPSAPGLPETASDPFRGTGISGIGSVNAGRLSQSPMGPGGQGRPPQQKSGWLASVGAGPCTRPTDTVIPLAALKGLGKEGSR